MRHSLANHLLRVNCIKFLRESGHHQLNLGKVFHYSGEGNGNPLQYSCLENPRDRGA